LTAGYSGSNCDALRRIVPAEMCFDSDAMAASSLRRIQRYIYPWEYQKN